VTLLLIDGHYYVYRSFHAIQTLNNSRGEPTNAIYGFVKTVRKMVKDVRPDLAAVFWDEGMPERRVQLQPAYKQQREAMPEKMIPQLDFIRSFVRAMGISSIALPNTEADDLMGCYVLGAAPDQYDIILSTNDKDLFQLVSEKVKVYSTNKADLKHPKDSHALLGVEEVTEKWGVPPAGIGEVLALTGDSVDNIPGVDGIGLKTASALIRQFGTIQNLLSNLKDVPSEKLRKRLEEGRSQILQNREMVKLDLDHPLPVPIADLKIQPMYDDYLKGLEQCEFKSLLNEIREEATNAVRSQGELFFS
jgi:5''-3'' exonuclease (including N-terminal domain of PolI)